MHTAQQIARSRLTLSSTAQQHPACHKTVCTIWRLGHGWGRSHEGSPASTQIKLCLLVHVSKWVAMTQDENQQSKLAHTQIQPGMFEGASKGQMHNSRNLKQATRGVLHYPHPSLVLQYVSAEHHCCNGARSGSTEHAIPCINPNASS